MKRVLFFAPVLVLAFLASAVPASAQTDDVQSLRLDAIHVARDVTAVRRQVDLCQTADSAQVLQLASASNDISRRAAGLAPRVGGREHVIALDLQSNAENDFWYLMTLPAPERCYQPPAE